MILYSGLYDDFYPFDIFWPEAKKITATIKADLDQGPGWLIIWGGGDIHPSLYGHPNIATYSHAKPSQRDIIEWELMNEAVKKGIGIIGVCRGAQMGCALAGGYLIQHVTGHAGSSHYVQTTDGKTLLTTSLHHQMMYPGPDVEHELIGWSDPPRSSVYEVAVKTEIICEPELIWFPKIKCLAIQGHPEMQRADCLFNEYIHYLMNKYILCLQK